MRIVTKLAQGVLGWLYNAYWDSVWESNATNIEEIRWRDQHILVEKSVLDRIARSLPSERK